MIIAILKDKKGFKMTTELPRFTPEINLPQIPDIDGCCCSCVKECEKIRFRFSHWVGENREVAEFVETEWHSHYHCHLPLHSCCHKRHC